MSNPYTPPSWNRPGDELETKDIVYRAWERIRTLRTANEVPDDQLEAILDEVLVALDGSLAEWHRAIQLDHKADLESRLGELESIHDTQIAQLEIKLVAAKGAMCEIVEKLTNAIAQTDKEVA
jgi:hypothetical protein